MPAKKNTKAKARPANEPQPEIKKKRRKTSASLSARSEAKDGRQTGSSSRRNPREQEIDEELALTFLTEYHVFEQALLRAGFTRAGRTPGSTRPDLGRFLRHIESHFDPDSSVVLQGAVAYLLYKPDNMELREERLERSFPWEIDNPQNDLVWLSELVEQVRNKLMLGFNFPETPACETAQVMAALMVVEAWSYMDPHIESLVRSSLRAV